MKYTLLTILAFITLFQPQSYALAEEENSRVELTVPENLVETYMAQPIEAIEDEYQPINLANLSRLYWNIGLFELTDRDAITNFLKINECRVYNEYVLDDFEWSRIVGSTKKYLEKNISSFSNRFEYIIPIYFGNYNIQKETFAITEKSQLRSSRKFDLRAIDRGRDNPCIDETLPGYTKLLFFKIIRPFSLLEVPMSAELADLYIQHANTIYDDLPDHIKILRYKRLAYLRLKIRITSHIETVLDSNGFERASVFGIIEGYEVYADKHKYKLLYSKDLKRKRRIRRKKPAELKESIAEEVKESEATKSSQ